MLPFTIERQLDPARARIVVRGESPRARPARAGARRDDVAVLAGRVRP
jgi:hypothetical protein